MNVGTLDIDFSSTTRGFTFEAWVWFDSTGSFARLFEFYKSGAAGVDNIVLTRSGTSADLGSRSARRACSTSCWPRRDRKRPVDARRGDGRCCGLRPHLLQGAQVAAAQLAVPTQISRDACWIGRSTYTQDAYFAGQLAEVRVWGLAARMSRSAGR